jgi:hypothetical protein
VDVLGALDKRIRNPGITALEHHGMVFAPSGFWASKESILLKVDLSQIKCD